MEDRIEKNTLVQYMKELSAKKKQKMKKIIGSKKTLNEYIKQKRSDAIKEALEGVKRAKEERQREIKMAKEQAKRLVERAIMNGIKRENVAKLQVKKAQ